mgnify:CR=1 FL=1
MPGNIHSQHQAALFGAFCAGRARKAPKGLSKAKACESLEGVKVKELPKKAPKRRRK